jgi:hypothetical protein
MERRTSWRAGAGCRTGQVVEIDEAFLGGSKRNHPKTSPEKRDRKVKVLGMVERGGRVRLQRVENFTTESLRPGMEANLSPDASKVVTDGAATYSFIVPKDKPVATNHEQELELTGMIRGTRTREGAFSLFKRGVIGSDHKLSTDPLASYLQESCGRYNRRGMQPFMFNTLLHEVATNEADDLQNAHPGSILKTYPPGDRISRLGPGIKACWRSGRSHCFFFASRLSSVLVLLTAPCRGEVLRGAVSPREHRTWTGSSLAFL